MKRSLMVVFVVALMLVGVQASHALTFEFGDDSNFWPGWGNGIDAGQSWSDDAQDTIGHPDLLGGSGVIDNTGNLTSLTFNYDLDFADLGVGDVFIDILNNGIEDKTWDFVLDSSSGKVYEVNVALGDSSLVAKPGFPDTAEPYMLSNKYYETGYREDHPVELLDDKFGQQVGTFVMDGPDDSLGRISFNSISGIDLDPLDSGVYNNFYIGFGPRCANDVIYEFVDPIPEPSTVLLLGLGLLGVAAVGRKRMKK